MKIFVKKVKILLVNVSKRKIVVENLIYVVKRIRIEGKMIVILKMKIVMGRGNVIRKRKSYLRK